MSTRGLVLAPILVAALSAPTSAAPPDHEITFPPQWVVDDAADPIGDGPAIVVVRAHPEDGSETCILVDLSAALPSMAELGITDPDTMTRVAVDMLGMNDTSLRSFGPGYSEPWSAFVEGTLSDGSSFAVYTYLGRDAWPGLEHAWVGLRCSSSGAFHQDWEQIGRTFAFTMPTAMTELNGPLVFGATIELPRLGLTLHVPEGWAAADLSHPGLPRALASGGAPGSWLSEQLDGSIADAKAKRAEAGQDLALWAWSTNTRAGWPEHCELVAEAGVEPFSTEALAAAGQDHLESSPSPGPGEAWSVATLPAGEAARYDYRWTETTGGSDFYLFIPPDRQVTLTCQDYALGDEADVEAKRDRWQDIARSLHPVPSPDPSSP